MQVHFVGIAGTGMGSLAGLLKARGHRVTGSDEGVYPPMSTALEGWGIPVSIGFRTENLGEPAPDLVVIGNVVRPDNPEARAAMERAPYLSFSDALYEHAIRGKHAVVVAGTHGKTTTTACIAALLHAVGRDPSMLVGGITADFDGSFRDGEGPEFVVEGDEYDTAFFDKTPKFHHYHADTLVVTSLEFDHADIYADLAAIQAAFAQGIAQLPAQGTLVAAADAPALAELLPDAPCRVVRYGVEAALEDGFVAHGLRADEEGTRFAVRAFGEERGEALLRHYGRYNVANALAALAVLDARGVATDDAMAALPAFQGVKRRQEVRGEVAGITVLDDFAHHPTAVRETLAALRMRYPGRRVVALFEPRSNTTRRALFQDEYAQAFDDADRVFVVQVDDAPIYSATGPVEERLSAERLVADLGAREIPAEVAADADAIVARLHDTLEPGDVVVTLSNGAFGNIWPKLLNEIRGRS